MEIKCLITIGILLAMLGIGGYVAIDMTDVLIEENDRLRKQIWDLDTEAIDCELHKPWSPPGIIIRPRRTK